MEEITNNEGRITFTYKTNDIKYYLLTEGSGYPLAEYATANFSVNSASRVVIPESMSKTSKTVTKDFLS
ncbi:MAG: hypothetical protein PHO01_02710 [Desulfotomaculaceae bacterium]|nr:hypothetical protein [Desulfotomaculaceae bacterium]